MTLRLFTFWLFFVGTISHELLSAQVDQNTKEFKRVASELIDSGTAPTLVNNTLAVIFASFTVKSFSSLNYEKALEVVGKQNYQSMGMKLEEVESGLKQAEDSLFDMIKANSAEIPKKIDQAVEQIIKLTKDRFIGILQADISSSVARPDFLKDIRDIKHKVTSRFEAAHQESNINGVELSAALDKLNEGLSDTSKSVQTIVKSFESSFDLFFKTADSFESSIKVLIGKAEKELQASKPIDDNVSGEIKAIISALLSFPVNLNRGISLAWILLKDLNKIHKNAVEIFGKEKAVAGAKNTWAFLTDLLAHLISIINSDKVNHISAAFDIAATYFSILIESYPYNDPQPEKFGPLINSCFRKNPNNYYFYLKNGSDNFNKAKQYSCILLVLHSSSDLHINSKSSFVKQFNSFVEINPTDINAFDLLQFYFVHARYFDYNKIEGTFVYFVDELSSFVANTSVVNLKNESVFARFDNYLVSKASNVKGDYKGILEAIRFFNIIYGSDFMPNFSFETLSKEGQFSLKRMLEDGTLNDAFPVLFFIARNADIQKKIVLQKERDLLKDQIYQKTAHNGQTATEGASQDQVRLDEISKQINQLDMRIEAEKLIQDTGETSIAEQVVKKEIYNRIIEALKSGYSGRITQWLLV